MTQYLTVLRTLCGKTAKSEGREDEGGVKITFKYAKKGAVSIEVEARIEKKNKNTKLQQRQLPFDTRQNFMKVRTMSLRSLEKGYILASSNSHLEKHLTVMT